MPLQQLAEEDSCCCGSCAALLLSHPLEQLPLHDQLTGFREKLHRSSHLTCPET